MKNVSSKVNTVRLQNLSYGHKQAATLRASIEIELFTKISKGVSTVSEIAESLNMSRLNAERIIVACASLGLIENSDQGFVNAPDVERFLVKDKVTYIGPWLLFNGLDFRLDV